MEGDRQEKKYIRLPAESVCLCAENLGIQSSEEVASSMVEDVSFRIRQLTHTAMQFMHHAKRRRLMVEDFDKALKWSSVEPLYGHSTSEAPGFHSIHESGLFSLQDHEVKLADVALSSPLESYTLPQPPTVRATWLSIEGVPLSKESEEVWDGTASVELKRSASESQQKYLSLLLEAITGDNEDLRRIALTDVQSNASIANILPDLVQYMMETLSGWVQFTPVQLLRVLKLLLALFRNSQLFLDPYASGLFALVKSIILNPSYLHSGEGFDHWHLRQMAAVVLGEVIRRCGSPLTDYVPDLHSSFRQFLAHHEVPLPVLYGTVLTLCHMGGKAIAEVLLPHLDAVSSYVQSLLDSTVPAEQEVALRVYETLLLAAELLLTSSSDIEPEVNQEQLAAVTGNYNASQFSGLTESSFFGPARSVIAPMEMDSSDIAGMVAPAREVPTLYDYLVDIFGERLSLRLARHQGFRTPVSTNKKTSPEHQSNSKRISTTQAGEKEKPSLVPQPKEDALLQFLNREGFKPIKVQLPQKAPPHRPPLASYRQLGRHPCRLIVPHTVLPVQSNVFQSKQTKRHTHRTAGPAALSPAHRGALSKPRHWRTDLSDISASWL